MADLRQQGIVTKVRTLKTGETVGGIPFSRGPLAHLLRNRFYIGEVPFIPQAVITRTPRSRMPRHNRELCADKQGKQSHDRGSAALE
jgi:hypothetical protein